VPFVVMEEKDALLIAESFEEFEKIISFANEDE
jgi:hypothetical protein